MISDRMFNQSISSDFKIIVKTIYQSRLLHLVAYSVQYIESISFLWYH